MLCSVLCTGSSKVEKVSPPIPGWQTASLPSPTPTPPSPIHLFPFLWGLWNNWNACFPSDDASEALLHLNATSSRPLGKYLHVQSQPIITLNFFLFFFFFLFEGFPRTLPSVVASCVPSNSRSQREFLPPCWTVVFELVVDSQRSQSARVRRSLSGRAHREAEDRWEK